MAVSPSKRAKKKDADNTFFLYVAFHAAISAVVNLFKDD